MMLKTVITRINNVIIYTYIYSTSVCWMLCCQEDRPPHTLVAPSSSPPPQVFHLQHLYLYRHADAIFHITAGRPLSLTLPLLSLIYTHVAMMSLTPCWLTKYSF